MPQENVPKETSGDGMMIFVLLALLAYCVFLIWAYIPDYKRNPKEFLISIISAPIIILLGFFSPGLVKPFREKMNREEKENK